MYLCLIVILSFYCCPAHSYSVVAHADPDSAELWTDIGLCLWGKGRASAAAACLNRALFICPTLWSAAYNRALVALTAAQYATACHHLTAAVALNPTHAPSFAALGVALGRMGDVTNASAAYDRSLRLAPHSAPVYLNYAAMLLNAAAADPETARSAGGALTPQETKAAALWDRYRSLFATATAAADAASASASAAAVRGSGAAAAPTGSPAALAAAALAPYSRAEIELTAQQVATALQHARGRAAADAAVAAAAAGAMAANSSSPGAPVGPHSMMPAPPQTRATPAAPPRPVKISSGGSGSGGGRHSNALEDSFEADNNKAGGGLPPPVLRPPPRTKPEEDDAAV